MHSRLFLASLASLLALAAPASAALVADLQAPLTIAVKLTSTNPLAPRDLPDGTRELQSRFVTARLTARDFIEKLIEDGRIVGPAPGWRLVARTDSNSRFLIPSRLYAVKPGQPDHALDASTLALQGEDILEAFRVRSRNDEVVSGRGSLKGSVTGSIITPAAPLVVAAVFDQDYTYRLARLGSIAEQLILPDSIRVNLVGDSQLDEEPGIAEGSLVFGRHQITSVRVAPETE
jgi:hypothetical protein